MINRLAAVQPSIHGHRVFWIIAAAIALVVGSFAAAFSAGNGIYQIGTDVVRSDARTRPDPHYRLKAFKKQDNAWVVYRDGKPWVTLTRGVKDITVSDPNRHNVDVVDIRPLGRVKPTPEANPLSE